MAAILPPMAARATRMVTIQNCPEAIERLVRGVFAEGRVVFVQEAGPRGYQVQRQITEIGKNVSWQPASLPRYVPATASRRINETPRSSLACIGLAT